MIRGARHLVLALAVGGAVVVAPPARGLTASELGIIYRRGDPASELVAAAYQRARGVPPGNVVGIDLPHSARISPAEFGPLRARALESLPDSVRALALVWTYPFAVGCMSVTTAFAAGYRPEFCEPGCGRTALSPLYDAADLESARRAGWRIAMLLPAENAELARGLIAAGVAAGAVRPSGSVYLVSTGDAARNVRASGYADVERTYGARIPVVRLADPVAVPVTGALAYFTGAARVREIGAVRFEPGAVADHLTSAGGMLDQSGQTTALDWIRAGATGSYGTVTEPCNHPGKFPSPLVFLGHYLSGDTLIEAYWKSVAMPGQGLFVGEPLAAPFSGPRRSPRAGAVPASGGSAWGF